MVEVGFANATTDNVAERAGASKATIYRWWENKACLLAEALRVAVGHELPFPNTGNLEQDIRSQLRNFASLINGKRGGSFRAFVAAAQSDPEVASAFNKGWVEPRRDEARSVLESYRLRGDFAPDQDLEVLLDAMYGPFYLRIVLGAERISLAYADGVARTVLNGAVRVGVGAVSSSAQLI